MADDVTVDNGGGTDYNVATQEMGDGAHVQEISFVHVTLNSSAQITQAEDAPATTGDPGLPVLGVRNDAGSAATSTDGDYGMLSIDSAGRLGVTALGGTFNVAVTSTTSITPGTGATNLGKAEDAAHASGDVGVMQLAVRNDAAATTLTSTDGDYSPIAVDNKGRQIITADTPINVAVTSSTTITPGTGATNLGKAEDAAHTSGDVGVMMLGVRNDSDANLSGTNGDYTPVSVDATGRVAVSLPSGGNLMASWEAGGEFYDTFSGTFSSLINNATVSTSSSGATSLVSAPGADNFIRVLSVALIANEAVNVKFQSASTDKTGLFYLAANGGFILPHNPHGWFRCAENEALNINLSAAKAVGGVITYATCATS